jgi:hypothetical protein
MIGRYTWVCSICGQGLTRRSSARRHNDNLHYGQANIVRPLEYMIRRVKGEFPSAVDPLFYRRKREIQVVHDMQNRVDYRNVPGQLINYNPNVTSYGQNPISQPQYKSADKELPTKNSRFEKITEFKRLAYKHYSRLDAETAIKMVYIQVNLGNEDFLDLSLEHLRNIEQHP